MQLDTIGPSKRASRRVSRRTGDGLILTWILTWFFFFEKILTIGDWTRYLFSVNIMSYLYTTCLPTNYKLVMFYYIMFEVTKVVYKGVQCCTKVYTKVNKGDIFEKILKANCSFDEIKYLMFWHDMFGFDSKIDM